jgi:hypothetical protein
VTDRQVTAHNNSSSSSSSSSYHHHHHHHHHHRPGHGRDGCGVCAPPGVPQRPTGKPLSTTINDAFTDPASSPCGGFLSPLPLEITRLPCPYKLPLSQGPLSPPRVNHIPQISHVRVAPRNHRWRFCTACTACSPRGTGGRRGGPRAATPPCGAPPPPTTPRRSTRSTSPACKDYHGFVATLDKCNLGTLQPWISIILALSSAAGFTHGMAGCLLNHHALALSSVDSRGMCLVMGSIHHVSPADGDPHQ